VSLAHVGSLEGRVLDEGLNPVRRAKVCAGFYVTYTDATGFYKIPALAAGEIVLYASRTGFRTTSKEIALVGGAALLGVDLILTLKDQGDNSISGSVADPLGNPIAGAQVYLMAEQRTLRSTTTDSQGAYKFESVRQDKARLQVSKLPGYMSGIREVELSATGVNFVLLKKVAISGTVKSLATGEPLQQLRINVYLQNDQGKKVRVGGQCRYSEDGSFLVHSLAGKIFVQVEAPGHDKSVFQIEVLTPGEDISGVELTLAKRAD
jgi:hypothetical protein